MHAAVNKAIQFCRFSQGYLVRNNPAQLFLNTIIEGIRDLCTMSKKKKIARYRVNHLQYRLYQMEQIIENGNPYNIAKGKNLDQLR